LNKLITTIIVILIITAIILGNVMVCGVVKSSAWCQWWPHLTLSKIVQFIQSSGYWGIGVSIGIMMIHSFIPFPAEFVAIANGMVYGAFWGTVITWVGAMFGAFLAFGLARLLGRQFVYRIITLENSQKVDGWVKNYGGQTLFISRLIPVIAFNLINYVAGLTKVSWWTFAWTTGLGILPITILMVVVGSEITTLSWRIWVFVIAAGLILWFIINLLIRNYRAKLP